MNGRRSLELVCVAFDEVGGAGLAALLPGIPPSPEPGAR